MSSPRSMPFQPLETRVFVHSPLIEYSSTDNYYVSYAIRLTSNNPSFTHGSSHFRRRYSEFVHLRKLLASHHSLVKPPNLPPKHFFKRFNQEFIEERRQGLQKFLEEVLAISVYLSDKSLHLFLQTSYSMSEIDGECLGDIPAPQLMTPTPDVAQISQHSDTSSSRSLEYLKEQQCVRALQNLVIDAIQNEDVKENLSNKFSDTTDSSSKFLKPPLSSALRKFNSKPFAIPRKCGSLDSTPSSTPPSSFEASYSSDLARTRRVSFNENVKIAVVTNYGISILSA